MTMAMPAESWLADTALPRHLLPEELDLQLRSRAWPQA